MSFVPLGDKEDSCAAERPPGLSIPGDWLSPGAHPLVLDMGCHRGHFLIQMAREFPETHFLGVEKQAVRVAKTRKKIEHLNLPNARVVQADGLTALRALPPGSIQGIHVLFPDPWPKRRHAPRRMVTREFLAECLRVLAKGSYLRIVTDDAPYAREIRGAANRFPQLVADHCNPPLFPRTAFELKFLAEAKPVETMYWQMFARAAMPPRQALSLPQAAHTLLPASP